MEELKSALTKAQTDISEAQSDLDELRRKGESCDRELKEANDQKNELESRVSVLEKKQEDDAEVISNLQRRLFVAGLGVSDDDLKAQIACPEADLDEANVEAARNTEEALEFAGLGFDKALAQIALVYPEVSLSREIFDVDHEIVDGQIIKTDLNTGERVSVHPH